MNLQSAPSKELLQRLYIQEQMSTDMIRRQLGYSTAYILARLWEYDIPIRFREGSFTIDIPRDELERLYSQELYCLKDISEHFKTSGVTIKRRLAFYNIPKRDDRAYNCVICGVQFLRDKGKQKVCPSCLAIELPCPCGCGQAMPKYRYSSEIKRCASPSCQLEGRIKANQERFQLAHEIRICKHCGGEFDIPQHMPDIFCSRECYLEYNHGPNHPQWLGGISREPYAFEFNEELKESIRQRDNYTCQLCGIEQTEQQQSFHCSLLIHHINYAKQDSREQNLIALCSCCNSKANSDRPYWQALFKAKIKQIYS